jgi:addiction module RelB/DinJ family antitoxin
MLTMPRSTTYQIRIEDDLRNESFELFRRLGLTPAQAIKMFLRQAVNTQSLPIPMSYKPNAETIQALEEARAGKNMVRCEDAEDLFRKLGL